MTGEENKQVYERYIEHAVSRWARTGAPSRWVTSSAAAVEWLSPRAVNLTSVGSLLPGVDLVEEGDHTLPHRL